MAFVSSGMFGPVLCAVLLLFLPAIVQTRDVRRPPSIIKNPIEVRDFRVGEDIKMECLATGHPEPEYTWYHNNNEIRLPGVNGNIQLLAPGLLQLSSLSPSDEGSYHCVANNQYGSVYSNSSLLRHGKISEGIQSQTSPTNYTVEEGASHRLECFKANSVPSPVYTWCITENAPGDQTAYQSKPNQECLNEDKRIQIDDEGTLHFAYVQKSDNRNGKVYKCNAFNSAVDTTKGGAYAKIFVIDKPGPRENKAPVALFHSGQFVTVLEGQDLTLRCFFSGHPIGTMAWEKRANGSLTPMPIGRFISSNNLYTIKITNVVPEDAGQYTCTMSNEAGTASKTMTVEVHARPMVKSMLDRPADTNVTEGDSVTFRCRPYANPTPTITWYRNNRPLDVNNLPYKMGFTDPSRSELIVRTVTRDRKDNGGVEEVSDISVIQCLVQNSHGRTFYSGYLNVLKKTELTRRPSDHTVSSVDQTVASVIFTCDATTDDSTPLSLRWFFNRTTTGGSDHFYTPVYPIQDRVILKDGNRSLEIKVANSSEWIQHGGSYKCLADNGYSNMAAAAHLTVELPVTVAPPPTDEVAEAGSLWWILLVVFLIFILLLLLLLCCWCCYRNRGKEYQVDKNERKNGNDPIKELNSTAFADYQRPSTDPMRGSRASLGSSIKMDSDDEESLNEYGDIDASKFGEDGSFIGDYNTESRRNHGYQRV